MPFDKTLIDYINITKADLTLLKIPETFSDIEKWESAFKNFESDDQEIQKFLSRYQKLGFKQLDTSLHIADLFCGKGNSLTALEQLGFSNLTGVDISEDLLSQYDGEATLYNGNCLDLHFLNDSTFDVIVIQGGIHHLDNLEQNLEKLFLEIKRILAPNGKFYFIEPWLTPYLQFVHGCAALTLLRRIYLPLCAFATMVYYESSTYKKWLTSDSFIQYQLNTHFPDSTIKIGWGKAIFHT